MSFETFVARRYLRAKRRVNLITIISVISICGITIGVAALIIVLSVFNGFNDLVTGQMVGFDPHLRITPADTAATINGDSIAAIIRSYPEVAGAAPFVSGRSAVVTDVGIQVIQVRGMRKADVAGSIGLSTRMIEGSFEDSSALLPHPIVLGFTLKNSLRVNLGDTISVLSTTGLEESMTQFANPHILRCIVSGVFQAQVPKEYDAYVAYTDMATARELFGLPSGAMGVEMRLKELDGAVAMKERLSARLGPRYRVETWQDLHADLVAVMEIERWAAFIILSLIIIVAVFNVLGSLTMTVIEKRRDIGILKTMGASDGSILRIFLVEGCLIGIIGTAAGVIVGVLVTLAQQRYGLVSLDTSLYIIAALPVDLRLTDLIVISVTSLLLATTSAIYPAIRAARLLPADAVRWE